MERPGSETNVPEQEQKPAGQPETEKRVNFGGRVRESVRKRARLYAVQHEIDLQDLLDAALDEYLRKRGG